VSAIAEIEQDEVKSAYQSRKDAEDAKRSLKVFSRFSLRPLRLGGEFCEAF